MRQFGELEAEVMARLWDADGPLTVRAVFEDLYQRRPIAYTTVMTVMDTLHRKGFLERTKEGRAYLYRPVASREAHAAELMGQVLASSGDREAAFTHFVERISPAEARALRAALERAEESTPRRGTRKRR